MTKVLQVNLFDAGLESAVQGTVLRCDPTWPRDNKLVSATGAHGLVTAYKEPEFKTILDSFYWNLPDGMPGVWIGKLKGAKRMTRCYGPDFFREVLRESAQSSIKHFFCGGQEGVADELKAAVGRKFGNYRVIGTFCPPFREMSDAEFQALATKISAVGTNIVWIGLSTPKQERFAQRLAQYVDVNFIVTVGAAFDFHTDRVKQAPSWMQKLSLEWLFRLMAEPKRLYRRYLEVVPLFIFLNLKEIFSPVK